MNNFFRVINRSQLRRQVLLIAAASPVLLGWYFGGRALADPPPAPATPPRGEVLVYTDNSPGAIVPADAAQRFIRETERATVVATKESNFVWALPTKKWSSVLVVARYSTTPPGYADALKKYVDGGGWAQIYYWRDDPKSPAPATSDSVVLAPTVEQIWMKGATSLAYVLCGKPQPPKTHQGYIFGDFSGVEPEPLLTVDKSRYAPLVDGGYLPNPRDPAQDSASKNSAAGLPPIWKEYAKQLNVELASVQDQLKADHERCEHKYGWNEDRSPLPEFDADKLTQCVISATEDFGKKIDAATGRYSLRLAVLAATTQPAR